MKKIFKMVALVLSPIAAMATIIGIYLQLTDKNTILNIKSISIESLTAKPKIDELKAIYTFRDSTVKNLWRGYYIIENSGNETIVGEGSNRNVITNRVGIQTPKNFRLLKYELKGSNFPISITSNNNNGLDLEFLQWRPDEYFELQMYFEGFPNDTIAPSIAINEREILNAKVEYSTLKSSKQEKRSLADLYLPNILYWVLFGLGMLMFWGIIFLTPVVLIKEANDIRRFKIWKKKFGASFEKWALQLVKDNKQTIVYTPERLPDELWSKFSGEEPIIPDYHNDVATLVAVIVILILFAAIPLMWMIKI